MKTSVLPLAMLVLAILPGCASLPGRTPIMGVRKSDARERTLSMARLMERHGKYDEAVKIYQEVLKSDPKNAAATHRLGIMAARRGEHKAALEFFETARKSGESAELLNDIGYTHYLTHDLQAAESALRAALQENSQFDAARNNLALVLAEQGRNDEALAEFRKTGTEAAALANLAFIQTKLGKLGDAEKNYHRVLELDPTHRPAAEALVQFQDIRNKADLLVSQLERKDTAAKLAEHNSAEPVKQVAPTQVVSKDPEIVEIESRERVTPVSAVRAEQFEDHDPPAELESVSADQQHFSKTAKEHPLATLNQRPATNSFVTPRASVAESSNHSATTRDEIAPEQQGFATGFEPPAEFVSPEKPAARTKSLKLRIR
ncbi:MAG: tetratricopeptide repeat protein [Planctomycetaceae bacterium]